MAQLTPYQISLRNQMAEFMMPDIKYIFKICASLKKVPFSMFLSSHSPSFGERTAFSSCFRCPSFLHFRLLALILYLARYLFSFLLPVIGHVLMPLLCTQTLVYVWFQAKKLLTSITIEKQFYTIPILKPIWDSPSIHLPWVCHFFFGYIYGRC